MPGKRKHFDIGRDFGIGQFIPVEQAEKRPSAATVERVPKCGYGTRSTSRRERSELLRRADSALSFGALLL